MLWVLSAFKGLITKTCFVSANYSLLLNIMNFRLWYQQIFCKNYQTQNLDFRVYPCLWWYTLNIGDWKSRNCKKSSESLGLWALSIVRCSTYLVNTMFRKPDLFPHLDEGKGTPTLLGPLERAIFNHWTTHSGRLTKSTSPVILCVQNTLDFIWKKSCISLYLKHYDMHKTKKYTFVREITIR
jgi:hypothetical protein